MREHFLRVPWNGAGVSISVSVRTFQRTIIDMGFPRRQFTYIALCTAQHINICVAWTVDLRIIGLLITGNTLLVCRISFPIVSGKCMCIGMWRTFVNPWTLHNNMRLFSLVESMIIYEVCCWSNMDR